MDKKHPAYIYARNVADRKIEAPKYVIRQCREFLKVANKRHKKYRISDDRVQLVDGFLQLMIMPKGMAIGQTVADSLAGFQWLFIIAILCTVYKDKPEKRRYETAILEISRKNGKTFLIAVIFILLLFIEPRFSKVYSVAPDGSLSREVKTAMNEIIASSPAFEDKFKVRNTDVECKATRSQFIPLNYSNSRLDGRQPSAFLIDEVGALPNNYAIEAMRSGQLTVVNKLGCIISTKYPKIDNPFEDEVRIAKSALDQKNDDTIFALLYEPDDKKNWMRNDRILMQANPLALEVPEIWDDLLKKRKDAILSPAKRENFVTKHCNIIYSGIGTNTYVPVDALQKCCVPEIDWSGRDVWVGVDLSMTTDNCAVAMVSEEDGRILAHVMCFIPQGRIEDKSETEHLDYMAMEQAGYCVACGGQTVDYSVIEDYVAELEDGLDVNIVSIGYDRYNAMSSAQKWEGMGYDVVEIRQHSDTLHPPTKLLKEKILNKQFEYVENPLMEINFQNARTVEDSGGRTYVHKKKSIGKIDEVAALIDAVFLLQHDVIFDAESDFGAQML